MPQIIHVVAAAIFDARGRVLLAQRPEGKHKGGLWEFPGGKLEADEERVTGLARELHEELGINIHSATPLIKIEHHYPERSVLLDVFTVDAWDGELHGREGQPVVWVEPFDLNQYDMPEADVPIVQAIQLPDTYLITPPAYDDAEVFLQGLEASLQSGIRLLQFRVFGDDEAAGAQLCAKAHALCQQYDARMLLSSAWRNQPGDGMHLNSRQLYEYKERPVAADRLLAVSCHSLEDLAQAQKLAADFVVLSPVLPTKSHPDAEPLGWETFAEMVAQVNLPVYALGGMKPAYVEKARELGAQGVSGIRGLWAGEGI